MKQFIFITSIIFPLSGCLLMTEPEPEKEIQIVTKTKVVKVNTGCPPMRMPSLQKAPASPKAQLATVSRNDNAAMDRILINYTAKLKLVINENERIVRNAVNANNAKCKK